MDLSQSLYFINAHNISSTANNSMDAHGGAGEQHTLSENVSFTSNSTYSADEQVIKERGQKRKLSSLDPNIIKSPHRQPLVKESSCCSPRKNSPKKIKRIHIRTSKSILRTPVKKRLKFDRSKRRC